MPKYSTDIHSYHQCLGFNLNSNNNDEVLIEDVNAFNFSAGDGSHTDYPFSISAWVNMQPGQHRYPILSKARGNPVNWSFRFEVAFDDPLGPRIRLRLYSGAGDHQRRREVALNENWENTWIHLVCTYDGSMNPNNIRYYQNGSELTETVELDNRSYDGMKIGVNYPSIGRAGANSQWDRIAQGYIDQVMVWDKELSQEEVDDIYIGEFDEDDVNLIYYSPMNEGLGDITYDHSSSELNGSIRGATWSPKVGFKN